MHSGEYGLCATAMDSPWMGEWVVGDGWGGNSSAQVSDRCSYLAVLKGLVSPCLTGANLCCTRTAQNF